MAFKLSVGTDPNQTIKLSGALDETADMSSKVPQIQTIHLDLAELQSINSTGIRIFKNWVYLLPCKSLILHNCPKVFIDQVNMIAGFIPNHTKIESFFVPFFNEETNEDINVLMKRGESYNVVDGEPKYSIPKPSGNFEPDIIESKYF